MEYSSITKISCHSYRVIQGLSGICHLFLLFNAAIISAFDRNPFDEYDNYVILCSAA
jgi:hypothetical protein